DGGGGHAGHDGEGEVPGRDDRADAERDVEEFVPLAGILDGRGRGGEAEGLASVKLKKINGFANVGVGLSPVLPDFIGEPGEELELAGTDDVGGGEEEGS